MIVKLYLTAGSQLLIIPKSHIKPNISRLYSTFTITITKKTIFSSCFFQKLQHGTLLPLITQLLEQLHFCRCFTFSQALRNRPLDRSCCPEVFCKKGVLKNFAKFTGKNLQLY